MSGLDNEPAGIEGELLSTRPPGPGESTEVPSARTSLAAQAVDAARCPECGTRRVGDDVFCETCGYDFGSHAREQAAAAEERELWELVVVADRDHFERGVWPGLNLPEGAATTTFPLQHAELRIGRGPAGGASPELDLEDPGVSRHHARLLRQDDNSYAIVDDGSTNGTYLDDSDTPLVAGVPVVLAGGQHVYVGAWTRITLRRIETEEE